MATFSYAGLNVQGKEITGQLQAESLADARTLLRGQGLRILELQQGELGQESMADSLRALWKWFRSGLSVRNSDLMLFYRQMQLMLRAGHTILEALEAAGKLAARPRLTMQLDRCAERIRSGSSFSAALAHERSTFPRIAVKLAEAGESSGELGGAALCRIFAIPGQKDSLGGQDHDGCSRLGATLGRTSDFGNCRHDLWRRCIAQTARNACAHRRHHAQIAGGRLDDHGGDHGAIYVDLRPVTEKSPHRYRGPAFHHTDCRQCGTHQCPGRRRAGGAEGAITCSGNGSPAHSRSGTSHVGNRR